MKYTPSWTEFGWNPWGFNEETEKPTREEMFSFKWRRDSKYVSTCFIEDFLQHNEVFKNGIKGNSCHMDSYMTIVDYAALETALNILVEEYKPNKEEWQNLVDAWLSDPNSQPPAKIVARHIERKYLQP